jgi:hypothetical protein
MSYQAPAPAFLCLEPAYTLSLFSWYYRNANTRAALGYSADRQVLHAYGTVLRSAYAQGGEDS